MGIFDGQQGDVFTTYQARLRMRDKLMGGIPKDPAIIAGWLRSKAGIEKEDEIRQATVRTLRELGAEVGPDTTFEEMEAASKELAQVRQTNGFKTGELGLYIESRTIKAMIKEATNILFAGDKWGATRKGPRNAVAEWVYVNPDKIWLGRQEPDGIDLSIAHVSGPRGPQTSLTYVEYVARPVLDFEVIVVKDRVKPEQWAQLWIVAQENGLGARRSQEFGRFDVERWDRVS